LAARPSAIGQAPAGSASLVNLAGAANNESMIAEISEAAHSLALQAQGVSGHYRSSPIPRAAAWES
jgi:hypothetical protein